MKNLYLRSVIIFVIVFQTSDSVAQISLTAPSGNTGPVAYTTLKAAFDAINLGTHTGDITISLLGNTTETSSAILNADGQQATSYTSVIIKPGEGVHPEIAGDFADAIIMLNGADNVVIDGSNEPGGTSKNLTISNIHLGGNCFIFINGASNNVIQNSIIQSTQADWNSGTILVAGSNTLSGNNYNTLENNDIHGLSDSYPHYAIHTIGDFGKPNTGNIYRNNRIFDFTSAGFYEGTDFGESGSSSKTLVDGNEFFSTVPQTNPDGIAIWSTGISEMTISNNIIHNLSSTNSLGGINLLEVGSIIVKNNFISLSESNFELSGISQQTSEGADVKIYHNTVYISGTASGRPSFAFYKNWFSTNDEIYNNIFINNRLNTSSDNHGQYAFLKVSSGTYKSDYNNLVSLGNELNYVGNQGPNRYSTLADWQAGTGQDSHSISVMPVFVSTSDLHIVPDNNMAIDNLGTPIPDNLTDIDGDVRSTSTPDMGADEFTFLVGSAVMHIDESIADVVFIPNLVLDRTTLRVHAQQDRQIHWLMLNSEGKVVMSFDQRVSEGQNDVELNLALLMPGSYFIIGQTIKGRIGMTRFIKSK